VSCAIITVTLLVRLCELTREALQYILCPFELRVRGSARRALFLYNIADLATAFVVCLLCSERCEVAVMAEAVRLMRDDTLVLKRRYSSLQNVRYYY